jgi:ATP-dependent Clp protease protease subunit
MIYIDVSGEVVNSQLVARMRGWFDDENIPFSLENVKAAIEDNKQDNDVMLSINSMGGDMAEGFAIYDYLRSTGKTVHANIISDCSSIATAILLAASKKNRSGNAHCTSVLHFGSGGVYGKVEDMEAQADLLRKFNDQLVDIYVDRTGVSRKRISDIMHEDKRHTASDLLSLGFISSINSYNTASAYMLGRTEELYKNRLVAMSDRLKAIEAPEAKPAENDSIIHKLNTLFT